ncbi:hypothetical protein MLD38_032877 [Melastoma candidum]|nr:hypothetical protein MLD38_032877 [Melastoma candidum]
MAIVASNSFHHHLGRKPETAPSSLYLQKTELLETKFTEKDEAMVEETIEVIKPMIAESDIASTTSSGRTDHDPSNPPSAALSRSLLSTTGTRIPERIAEEEPGKYSTESEERNLPDEQEGDTLDSIWKAITEGQGKQPMAQLKKSDTWETATRRALNEAEPGVYDERAFRKSETFRERTAAVPTTVMVDREVAKEKSMGLDELNLRIEAFIRKNWDDMRLQREESARKLVEMVNGRIVLRR